MSSSLLLLLLWLMVLSIAFSAAHNDADFLWRALGFFGAVMIVMMLVLMGV